MFWTVSAIAIVTGYVIRELLNHVVLRFVYQPPSVMAYVNYRNPIKLTPQKAQAKKAIIFFHGNASSAANMKSECDILSNSFQRNTYIPEYCGYGVLAQMPLLSTITSLENVVQQIAENYDDILMVGQSLGSHFAARMAAMLEPTGKVTGLVLISPFVSLSRLSGIPESLLWPENRFNTVMYLRQVSKPLLLIHGKLDSVISWRHSEELLRRCEKTATLQLLKDKDHNDLEFTEIARIMQKTFVHLCQQPSQQQA